MFTLLAMSSDNINWVSKRLAAEACLTSQDIAFLQERLPVVFRDRSTSRQQKSRRGHARAGRNLVASSRLKSAHFKYRDILCRRPHVFLEFILAVGIRACSSCDILDILQRVGHSYPTTLSLDVKRALESVAQELNIHQHPLFSKWIEILFGSKVLLLTMFDHL